ASRLGLPVRPGLASDEVIVVQGVVDVAVIEPEDIWLVDFKTDRVTAASLEAKLRAYTPQLALYAMALGRIHRRPVREAWLYFLATGQAASVPLPGFLQPDEQPA
ncbi:MAG: PD-(D/E)XK nuclease family protein, partial [Verrucomicrobiae bacterium]|nr:PD-(D/E)XK nuclease family protein [Verrucomicrobiae bacterium]